MVLSSLVDDDFYFTFGGDLVTSQNSNIPGIPAKKAGTIRSLKVSLKVAPTGSAAIFNFKKNGVQFGQVTVNAGSTLSNYVLPTPESYVENDIMTTEIAQVGSGVPGKSAAMIMET